MKWGGKQGELSHAITPCQLHTQQGKRGLAHWYYFTIPAPGRKALLLSGNSQPMRDSHTSANERSTLVQVSSLLPEIFFVCNRVPTSPFLYTRAFLSFVLRTGRWFFHNLLVPDCNSLLFLNKTILAGKTTGLFLRLKVVSYNQVENTRDEGLRMPRLTRQMWALISQNWCCR